MRGKLSFCVVCFVTVSLLISANVGASKWKTGPDASQFIGESKYANAALVRLPIPESGAATAALLTQLGILVIETYDGFVLASASDAEVNGLVAAGFEVNEIPERTITGRGAFIFDTRVGPSDLPQCLRSQSQDMGYFILQMAGPVKAEWVDTLRSLDVQILTYLPTLSFVVRMSLSSAENVAAMHFVQWIGTYEPGYKLSPLLDVYDEKNTEVIVSLFAGRSSEAVISIMESADGTILNVWESGGCAMIRAEIPGNHLPEVAQMPEVEWIEGKSASQCYNSQATWVVQSNSVGQRTIFSRGITGEGQLVTIADSGISMSPWHSFDHEMWYDPLGNPIGTDHRKIQNYYVPAGSPGALGDETGHGSHVIGTVLGDSPIAGGYNTYNGNDGNAFGARAIVQDIDFDSGSAIYPPDDLNNLFQPSYDEGSRIHTNSWGGGWGVYTLDSKTIDEFMWNHPDYLILFAAGNAGPNIGSIYSDEANSKNSVAVGASGNGALAGNLALGDNGVYFSSRGSVGDDRQKPTVMAPGQDIMSAQAGTQTGYISKDGTSMAAPCVAGCAALVRQYFVDGWYPLGSPSAEHVHVPSAALMKAILINSAEEMTGAESYGQTVENAYSIVEVSEEAAADDDPPYGLRVMKLSSYDGGNYVPVRAVSRYIDLDYSSPYRLEMKFQLVEDVIRRGLVLVDDGRSFIQVIGDQMYISRGPIVPVTAGIFHDLELIYDPPSQTYDVYLDGNLVGDDCEYDLYYGDTEVGQIAVGSTILVSYKYYGEIYFDEIRYTGIGGSPVYFEDDFNDGDISDWMLRTGPTAELEYPNNHQGWGRINLENSLFFEGDTRRLYVDDNEDGLSTGQSASYQFEVVDSNGPLEVTLVWTDYPGAAGTLRAIVNDLNLRVVDPLGNEYKGNVYSDYGYGQSVVGGAFDALNIEESVLRLSPTIGDWTVFVEALNVPTGPQPFALVIAGPLSGDAPSAPTALTATPVNDHILLEWNAPSNSGGYPIEKYKVYRGTVPGGETYYDEVPAPEESYLDTAATNGATFYYKVTAVNEGGLEGTYSNEATATAKFRLSVGSNSGGHTVPGGISYWDPGSVVTITPYAYDGFRFWYWLVDDVRVQGKNLNVEMDADHTVYAMFKRLPQTPRP